MNRVETNQTVWQPVWKPRRERHTTPVHVLRRCTLLAALFERLMASAAQRSSPNQAVTTFNRVWREHIQHWLRGLGGDDQLPAVGSSSQVSPSEQLHRPPLPKRNSPCRRDRRPLATLLSSSGSMSSMSSVPAPSTSQSESSSSCCPRFFGCGCGCPCWSCGCFSSFTVTRAGGGGMQPVPAAAGASAAAAAAAAAPASSCVAWKVPNTQPAVGSISRSSRWLPRCSCDDPRVCTRVVDGL